MRRKFWRPTTSQSLKDSSRQETTLVDLITHSIWVLCALLAKRPDVIFVSCIIHTHIQIPESFMSGDPTGRRRRRSRRVKSGSLTAAKSNLVIVSRFNGPTAVRHNRASNEGLSLCLCLCVCIPVYNYPKKRCALGVCVSFQKSTQVKCTVCWLLWAVEAQQSGSLESSSSRRAERTGRAASGPLIPLLLRPGWV